MPNKSSLNQTEKIALAIAQGVGTPLSIIIHSIFFVGIFSLRLVGFAYNDIMLILTTVVSLEAIYLSLFIQMTVNRHREHLEDVEEDIDDIQEDVEDISEDIDNVQEDVESLESNIKEIQEDVEGIEADVEDIAEEAESEETPTPASITASPVSRKPVDDMIFKISRDLLTLSEDIKALKRDMNTIKQKANHKDP